MKSVGNQASVGQDIPGKKPEEANVELQIIKIVLMPESCGLCGGGGGGGGGHLVE